MRTIIFFFSFMLFFSISYAVPVDVSIDYGSRTVYSGSHFISAYDSSSVIGLASSSGTTSQSAGRISLSDDSSNSMYLGFTRGDYKSFSDRIRYIEENQFFSLVNPSFGFALTDKMPVYVVLSYPSIDFVGSQKLRTGLYSVIIRNTGLVGNKVGIEIKES